MWLYTLKRTECTIVIQRDGVSPYGCVFFKGETTGRLIDYFPWLFVVNLTIVVALYGHVGVRVFLTDRKYAPGTSLRPYCRGLQWLIDVSSRVLVPLFLRRCRDRLTLAAHNISVRVQEKWTKVMVNLYNIRVYNRHCKHNWINFNFKTQA